MQSIVIKRENLMIKKLMKLLALLFVLPLNFSLLGGGSPTTVVDAGKDRQEDKSLTSTKLLQPIEPQLYPNLTDIAPQTEYLDTTVATSSSSSTQGSRKKAYQTLGLSEDASQKQVRKAYLQGARNAHPDKTGNAGDVEEFQKLQAAYEFLMKNQKKDNSQNPLLIENDEKINDLNNLLYEVFEAILDDYINNLTLSKINYLITKTDGAGNTFLHKAAISGSLLDLTLAYWLIAFGADKNTKNNKGETAYQIYTSKPNNMDKIASMLDPDKELNQDDKKASKLFIEMFKQELALNPHQTINDFDKTRKTKDTASITIQRAWRKIKTPRSTASDGKLLELPELMQPRGPQSYPNLNNTAPKTPYQDTTVATSSSGSSKGSKSDKSNSDDPFYMVMYGAANGDIESIKQGLKIDSSLINAKEDLGNNETPLHMAAEKGHLETVQYLLDNGANPTIKDGFGEAPGESTLTKNEEIKRILENARDSFSSNYEAEQEEGQHVRNNHYDYMEEVDEYEYDAANDSYDIDEDEPFDDAPPTYYQVKSTNDAPPTYDQVKSQQENYNFKYDDNYDYDADDDYSDDEDDDWLESTVNKDPLHSRINDLLETLQLVKEESPKYKPLLELYRIKEVIKANGYNKHFSKTVNQPITGDKDGDTLLHLAVKAHDYENILFLIQNGANRNVKNNSGKNPYQVAELIKDFPIRDLKELMPDYNLNTNKVNSQPDEKIIEQPNWFNEPKYSNLKLPKAITDALNDSDSDDFDANSKIQELVNILNDILSANSDSDSDDEFYDAE